MLNRQTKILTFILLLMFSSSQMVSAGPKLYKYDGKMPFVQMMLSMMVAMGIIDRYPTNGRYGLSSSPYSRFNNPYMSSPWSRTGLNDPSYDAPLWGNPSWGVLPMESYTQNYYAPYDSQRSSSDLNGWVNESWETSQWNTKAQNSTPATQSEVTTTQNNNNRKSSPLAKHANPEYSERPVLPQSAKKSPLRKQIKQKPCVTEFCGLKKPSLNGLWVSQKSGEMLGINNARYLWNDGRSRYLAGKLKVQNEYLVASVDGYDQLMRFKYKLAGNHLLTLQPDGTTREFVRLPYNQYQNYGQTYGQGSSNPYYR